MLRPSNPHHWHCFSLSLFFFLFFLSSSHTPSLVSYCLGSPDFHVSLVQFPSSFTLISLCLPLFLFLSKLSPSNCFTYIHRSEIQREREKRNICFSSNSHERERRRESNAICVSRGRERKKEQAY